MSGERVEDKIENSDADVVWGLGPEGGLAGDGQ